MDFGKYPRSDRNKWFERRDSDMLCSPVAIEPTQTNKVHNSDSTQLHSSHKLS